MEPLKLRVRQIEDAIHEILLHRWDPIGVAGISEARDEYDSYIGGIYRLIASGAKAEEIAEHLAAIERDEMGLQPVAVEKLLPVAAELAQLVVTL